MLSVAVGLDLIAGASCDATGNVQLTYGLFFSQKSVICACTWWRSLSSVTTAPFSLARGSSHLPQPHTLTLRPQCPCPCTRNRTSPSIAHNLLHSSIFPPLPDSYVPFFIRDSTQLPTSYAVPRRMSLRFSRCAHPASQDSAQIFLIWCTNLRRERADGLLQTFVAWV